MKKYIMAVFRWWWAIAVSVFVAAIQLFLYFKNANIIFLWIGISALVLGLILAQYIVFRKKSSAYNKLKAKLITAEQIETILTELGKLRESGVALRNEGRRLKQEEQVRGWIEKAESWNKNVLSEIEKLSPSEAAIFSILDWVTFPTTVEPLNFEHDLHLRMFSQRLIKLENLVLRYSIHNVSRKSSEQEQ
ncbi:hypothetical protein ES705_18593 [subsurface metagenome]